MVPRVEGSSPFDHPSLPLLFFAAFANLRTHVASDLYSGVLRSSSRTITINFLTNRAARMSDSAPSVPKSIVAAPFEIAESRNGLLSTMDPVCALLSENFSPAQ